MYDLEKDPLEVQNVADDKKYRGYRQDLEGELKRLRAQFGDDDQVKVR
jgi:hypothetical protein